MSHGESISVAPNDALIQSEKEQSKSGAHGEGASLNISEKPENKETLKVEIQNVVALEELAILLKQAKAKNQNTAEVMKQVFQIEFSNN